MRRIYTIFLYLLIPFICIRLLWKSRKLSAYRKRIPERFAMGLKKADADLWLHAVSLGEVVAATPLINALLENGKKVVVTTMTPTGSQQVNKTFGDKVMHYYVPYDLPMLLRRFLKHLQPKVVVIFETELWPNLINTVFNAKIPLLLVNGRISERAFKHYKKFRFFFKPLLKKFSHILVQSAVDAERFKDIGAQSAKVLGNIKFDVATNPSPVAEISSLPDRWGKDRTVVILASTHDDEEAQILAHTKELQAKIPNLLLLIAPRHPERFDDVCKLCNGLGLNAKRRSTYSQIDKATEVVIVDSLGELLNFYALSDFAFVGGSLVNVGGHNVLEAISLDVPVFCGPFMSNSQAVCEQLIKVSGIQICVDASDLVSKLVALYKDSERCHLQVMNSKDVLQQNKGSLQLILEVVKSCG